MQRRDAHLLAFAAATSLTAAANAQEDLIIDRNRPDRNPPRAASHAAPTQSGAQIETPTTEIAPFVLRDVRVENSSLSNAEIERAIIPLRGRTFDGASLREIPEAIAAAYENEDVALYTIAVPPQDFTDGAVRLAAIEGHVSNVAIGGDVSGDIDLARHYAAQLTTERPLRRSTLERGMLLLSDIPGLKTNVSMAPAADPGGATLGLELERKRFEYALDIDGYGANALGRVQLTASLIANGLFRLGDQSVLSLGSDTQFERYSYVALAHRQPLGHRGASITGRFSNLETNPPGGVEGDAQAAGLVVPYPVVRSYKRNLTVSFGADGLNSDSALLGDMLASERTRVLRVAAAYSYDAPRKSWSASAALSRGLDEFGARSTAPAAALDFTKLTLQAGAAHALGESWAARVNAAGQLSADPLPASERFAMGGAAIGRAFAASEIAGDAALGAAVELAWLNRPQGMGVSELYGFVDGGRVWNEDRPPFIGLSRDLASAGLGARFKIGEQASLALEAAQSIDEPLEGVEPRGARLGFALAGRF